VHQSPDPSRRWLRRSGAASYLSISERKFDSLRKAGVVPPPSSVIGVALYDRLALDALLERAPAAANDNDANPWDDAL
jgi:hypothetical protein